MNSPDRAILTRKIALMGYPCVGKSSITLRFVQGYFPDSYDTTIEDMHSKNYKYEGRDYNLKITDTAGQQEYSVFPRSCSVDIHGFILVYAIDDRKSFEMIQSIYDKVVECVGDVRVPMIVVGNKVDLQHSCRVISRDEGAKLAKSWNAAFIETSAKDNTAVNQIFDRLLKEIEVSMMTDDSPEVVSRVPGLPRVAEAVSNVDFAQVAGKVESIKKWTIGTFKNSRQQLLEHMGKIDKTVDPEFEEKCDSLKEIHQRYGAVVLASRQFSQVLSQMAAAEKKFSESFFQLSVKEDQLKAQCNATAEVMKQVGEQASSLDICLRYFISSMETIYSQTIADTLETIYSTEAARIEYDVHRHELANLQNSPTENASEKVSEASEACETHRKKYEQYKEDVKVKLKLLEENRIQVVSTQLEKIHAALAAYYSGNAKLLESSVRELFASGVSPPSFIPNM
ncbi:unnamed protein product [Caenorhabditis auriculariae]|uniref:AH domain-containing protein n=1 Tax=Caenorhabditis auriculariae TaxID=2777116 RepID=A0A8S1GYB3_9PELO|nr:unnamed protein product [Caenorhabditis auriculariae]